MGADAIFVRTDVAKSQEVDALVARAVETYGRLDCAFNNAGIGDTSVLTHECSEEEWNQVLAVNLTGVWLCMKAEITQMLNKAFEKRPDIEERYARAEPMKRIGQPEEVGEAVAWLCSDRASYLTGLPMPVDGGYMAQ
jgi:NAD(P)-dependent dehydrogenase (short-subunit alcohol dehydrogenase family)